MSYMRDIFFEVLKLSERNNGWKVDYSHFEMTSLPLFVKKLDVKGMHICNFHPALDELVVDTRVYLPFVENQRLADFLAYVNMNCEQKTPPPLLDSEVSKKFFMSWGTIEKFENSLSRDPTKYKMYSCGWRINFTRFPKEDFPEDTVVEMIQTSTHAGEHLTMGCLNAMKVYMGLSDKEETPPLMHETMQVGLCLSGFNMDGLVKNERM